MDDTMPADGFAPTLSIILVVYDMAREAPRTLYSLTPEYQEGAESLDYEVIVVDNGSPTPLGEDTVGGFGDRFRYHYVDQALPSPCRAVNEAVAMARGSVVGIAIDGARLFSPGVLRRTATAFQAFREPVVATLSLELGSEPQQSAIGCGYDKAAEDALIAEVGWPAAGYRLFDIAVMSTSGYFAPFRPIGESNCLFLRKSLYRSIGCMNEGFSAPGGGFANLDLFERAVTTPGVTPVILLGEGTFHQLHGGVSTGVDLAELDRRVGQWRDQYKDVVGREYVRPEPAYQLIGHVPPEFLRFVSRSASWAIEVEGLQVGTGDGQPDAAGRPAGVGRIRGWLRRLKQAGRRFVRRAGG